MRGLPAGDDYDGWVARLGSPSRRQQAKRHLRLAGAPALPALHRGLSTHPDPIARQICAGILDHLANDESIPVLVAAIDDEDPRVRARALHALACDQCKQNECRPDDDLFVPRALELVEHHPDARVRAAAIDALGKVAHRRPDVAPRLAAAAQHEPDRGLRELARRRSTLPARSAREASATTA